MKTTTDTLWEKIEELNTLHKQTVRSVFAIINIVEAMPHPHTGAFIKEKRKYLNITQAEMAEKVGCSRNYLAQIEKMEILDSVSFGIVCGIAYALNVSLYELVN